MTCPTWCTFIDPDVCYWVHQLPAPPEGIKADVCTYYDEGLACLKQGAAWVVVCTDASSLLHTTITLVSALKPGQRLSVLAPLSRRTYDVLQAAGLKDAHIHLLPGRALDAFQFVWLSWGTGVANGWSIG